MSKYENDPNVGQFLNQIEQIPWFENVGQSPDEQPNDQIHSWDEWRGPEEPTVMAMHESQQALYDELTDGESNTEMTELWQHIHSVVIPLATSKVPYEAEVDTWHAPNMAVWHAAWTAGLVGLCLFAGRSVPRELQEQWNWFLKGHWPCDWSEDSAKAVIF